MDTLFGKGTAISSTEVLSPSGKLRMVPEVREAAKPKIRHYAIAASFCCFVILPILLAAWYLYTRAADQFASTVGFSVHAEEMKSPLEIFGGFGDLSGSASSDADILYEYVRSQELISRIDAELDLRDMFSGSESDWIFSFDPADPIEDLVSYWNRMVRVDYDKSTGLIEIRVLAFNAEDAEKLAAAIFDECARMINELSDIAREDLTRYAQEDLDDARARLVEARQELTEFRSRTQIVDPKADVQTQMGLLGSLEEQEATALIELDLLKKTTRDSDLRISLAEQKIGVIRERISEERRRFGMESDGSTRGAYAMVVSEFERLSADREFAEAAHQTALASYYTALAEARRKSRYLAAYIAPTRAESAEYPRRALLVATVAAFAIVGWSVMVLIFYSIRDRR